jgi:ATPase subunit of ABC transporter with duplicated ATPase domains
MLERELEWVRSNPKARQAKSKARLQRFEELSSREFQEAQRDERDSTFRPVRGSASSSSKARACARLRREAAVRRPDFNLPQGGIVGIIGPTARARPRCSGS